MQLDSVFGPVKTLPRGRTMFNLRAMRKLALHCRVASLPGEVRDWQKKSEKLPGLSTYGA